MKKAGYVLLIVTIMICIFALGFLLGRNANHAIINVSQTTTITNDPTSSSQSKNKININTASVDELTLLPGIGPTLAQRIVDYRETFGRFRAVSDLYNIEGLGEKKLLSIIDYITI